MPRGNMLDEAVMLDEWMMFLRKKGDRVLGGKEGLKGVGERLLSRMDSQSVWSEDLFLRGDEM
ncbi:hypothetical protein [Bartonella sp. MR168JLCBS]|uniref:hypothetical protein n=1 Tax=Bartonella sp. MR168JLCBS TaxID=3243556 RepID=UPI0035CFDF07